MQPHQERVVTEKKELDEKIDKLVAFLAGKTFSTLAEDEQMRLIDQKNVMQQYSEILRARIAAFTK